MPVVLESRVKRMQVFNLDHEGCCRTDRCGCAELLLVLVDENPRTGERSPRRITKKIPASLTLLALERREGLGEEVLEAAEVKAAIVSGFVRVIEQTPAPRGRKSAPEGTSHG